ncbi:MAG: DUF1328 domain-containing protein [Polyangia bacterium]
MLTLALVFLVVAIFAGLFGFTGLSASAFGVVKFLVLFKIVCAVFMFACIALLFRHFTRSNRGI